MTVANEMVEFLAAIALPERNGGGSIDPDTRGATTIREQLTTHRQAESCASCHVHIDPILPASLWKALL